MERELILKTNCYVTTLVGTQVTRESTPDEWANYGEILRRVDEAKQWAIGDWLADGKRHYGDGLYKRAAELTGQSDRTLEDYKRMSDAFEITLRNVKLSYNHHKEAASLKQIASNDDGKLYLSDETAQETISGFLSEAEKHNMSVKDLRDKVRAYKEWQRQQIAAANEPEKYAVIYADPPWQYTSGEQHNVNDESETSLQPLPYDSMPLSDICALPQAKLAATDSVLFLWCTSPTLEEALQVIKAWDFKYKASMIWDKVAHNVGHYVSVRHELLLIATKGQPPKVPKLVDSVYVEERGEHSRKPAYFRELIDELYSDGKRIELFCRGDGGEQWDTWGNES